MLLQNQSLPSLDANLTSTEPASATTEYEESDEMRYLRFTLFGVISLASVVGNAIIIKSVISIPYKKPLTYTLTTNLAIAELVSTIFLLMLVIYEEIKTWPFGDFMCHLTSPIQILSGLVVTWSMALISIHRFVVITSPGSQYIKKQELLMVLLWLAATAITFPLFMYSKMVMSPFDPDTYWCFVLFPGDSLSSFPSYRTYHMVRFMLNYILPIVIMIAAYGALGFRLKYHIAFIRTVHSELTVPNSGTHSTGAVTVNGNTDIEASEPNNDNNNDAILAGTKDPSRQVHASFSQTSSDVVYENLLIDLESDLLRMIYAIILIFVVCYIPYQVFYFLEYFDVVSYQKWRYFTVCRRYIFLITCLPSALHPLCYGTMSKFYAKAFARIVLCKWRRRSARPRRVGPV
ncbi:substance-K receptor [Nematostella vectensis]|uniref:substance-K receptor n=1 Tax=Nematostella vectensis TaxID=45351 RepID=UPI00207745F5|nr:substance-K receptor [Nematostella vectensis]XP_032236758.2 substance-K receptor [Nematostella vectensis]XP_048582999.1 substance-K receptor [Nematostella vectensis]